MGLIKYFIFIFRTFPLIFSLNVVLLVITGLMETLALLSLTPIVDLYSNPDLKNVSSITHKLISYIEMAGFPATIMTFIGIFIVANLVKSILNILYKYITLVTKYNFLEKILVGSFKKFFNSGFGFFASVKSGVILNTFVNEASIVGNSISSLSLILSHIIRLIFFFIVPFSISIKLSLISLFLFGIVSLPSFLVDRLSYRWGKKNVDTANALQGILHESFAAVKVIFGFGNNKKNINIYKNSFENHRGVTIPFQMISTILSSLFEPLLLGVIFLIFYLALNNFKLPLSEVFVLLYALKNLSTIIIGIVTEKNNVAGFVPSFEQIELLQSKADSIKEFSGAEQFLNFKHNISFNNVHFSYEENKQILNGLTLTIPKGKMVAFVGKSGAGKTTIVDLLMGLYPIKSGEIKIDNKNFNQFEYKSYREKIGFVPQDPILFNNSIKENLKWAKEDATDEEIIEALSLSHAINFDLNSNLGERGSKLSGGERQRIAFARAIIRKPELLILDEATSALDNESEKAIQDAISDVSKQTTIVVIAHRLSTIKKADIIYYLQDGKVLEQGSFSDLLNLKGEFYKLAMTQEQHF